MSSVRTPLSRLWLYGSALVAGAVVAHVTSPAARGARAPETPDVDTAVLSTVHDVVPQEAVAGPDSISGDSVAAVEPVGPAPLEEGGHEAAFEPKPLPKPAHDALAEAYKGGRIMTGETRHRFILFTFDDGPDRRHTPLLLDRLDAEGVKAVFFLTASRLQGRNRAERQQVAIARDIVARGHLLGSHTLDHKQLPLLNDREALAQIVGAERVFERVFGARPWLFRPPGGASSLRIDRLVAARGYTTMLWNIGAGDFQVRSAEEVYATWRKVFERREREAGDRGGIILLHDTYPWSVDAFQMILGDLRRRNCELLAEGEELFDVLDDPSVFFEPQPAGRDPQKTRGAVDSAVLEARQARARQRASAYCGSL